MNNGRGMEMVMQRWKDKFITKEVSLKDIVGKGYKEFWNTKRDMLSAKVAVQVRSQRQLLYGI